MPETNETDNTAVTPLPNLRVAAPSYNENGDITYGYQIQNAGVATQAYVTLGLYYASGPSVADILPGLPPVHETTLDLHAGPEHLFMLSRGSFPIPTSEASHLVALIDRNNAIREGAPGKVDNAASVEAQPAPGYHLISRGKGVGIYSKTAGNVPAFCAVIVDLTRASFTHFVTTGLVSIGNYWPLAVRRNDATHYAKAVLNGTFFDGSYVTGYSPTYGLKVNGSIIGPGTRANDPIFAGKTGFFEYQGQSASILPYSTLNDPRFKDMDGVITGIKVNPKDPTKRTWVALRDPVAGSIAGEKRYRTAIIFIAIRPLKYQDAFDEISLFDPDVVAQLDSGSSSSFNEDGHTLLDVPLWRWLPYGIGIFASR